MPGFFEQTSEPNKSVTGLVKVKHINNKLSMHMDWAIIADKCVISGKWNSFDFAERVIY